MEVMVAVQSSTLLHALRFQLKRRVSDRRGGEQGTATKSLFSRGCYGVVVLSGVSVLLNAKAEKAYKYDNVFKESF